MINVLLFFLALTIFCIVGISCFVVGVKANVMNEGDNATIISEEAEKLEDALYSVALSCKTELQVIY